MPILHPVLTIACTFSLTITFCCLILPCISPCFTLGYNSLKYQCKLSDKPLATPQGKLQHITYLTIAPTLTPIIKKAMKLIIAQTPILPLVLPCDNGSPHLTHYLTSLHSPLTHYTCSQTSITSCFDITSYLTSNLMVTSTHLKTHHR